MSILSVQAALALALQCSSLDPNLMVGIAAHESGLDPLTINDNTTKTVQRGPGVIKAARNLIAAGHSVDLGAWQINSRNLGLLALTVEDAFDPCRAVAAAGRLIELQSQYNTGSPTQGIANGYAAAVTASVRAVRAQSTNVIPADIPTAQQEEVEINDRPADTDGDIIFSGE